MSRMRPILLVVSALVSGVLLLALVAVAASVVGEPISNFTRDAVAVADVPWYTGSVSLITCMVWAATAAMSFFVAWAVPGARRPMLALGVFTLVLAVDDAMLVHDQIGPGQGVPEVLFPVGYASLALLVLWEVVRGGTRTTISVYLLGAALFALSLLLDQLLDDISIATEDSAKLLGVLVWATVPALFYDQHTAGPGRDRDAELARKAA